MTVKLYSRNAFPKCNRFTAETLGLNILRTIENIGAIRICRLSVSRHVCPSSDGLDREAWLIYFTGTSAMERE